MPKFRNIIIFLVIASVIGGGAYIFFLKPDSLPEQNLITTPGAIMPPAAGSVAPGATVPLPGNFLSLLLNVKNIKLEESVLADPAFQNLRDSSIVLSHDGTAGRPNPFAKLGIDTAATPPVSPVTPPPPSVPEGAADEPAA